MNYCTGKLKIDNGIRYTSYGVTAHKTIYCEYCHEKCVDPSTAYYSAKVTDCVCECSLQSSHPVISLLICPACCIDSFDRIRRCIKGCCTRCNLPTPYFLQRNCIKCSYQLKNCSQCDTPITNGNEYIERIKKLVSERIANEITNLEIDGKEWEPIHKKNIGYFEQELTKAKRLYHNKTADEMFDLIIKRLENGDMKLLFIDF